MHQGHHHPHQMNRGPQQYQQPTSEEVEEEPQQVSFLEVLSGHTRAIIIHEFLSMKAVLSCCIMYVPMFRTLFSMYRRYTMMCMQFPMMGVSAINQATQSFPSIVRQILGGFGVYLGVLLYFIHNYLVSSIIPNLKEESNSMIDTLGNLRIVALIAFVICFFSKPGSISHNWTEQDLKDLQNERLEFTTSRCLCRECQKPKVARSAHCEMCGTCIARSNKHDYVTNNCIGAKNYLQYLIHIFTLTTYIVYSLYVITRTYKQDYKSGLSGIIYLLVLLYLTKFYLLKSLVHLNLALNNLTEMEIENWQRLPYLWKDQTRYFYNPFCQGIVGNIIELFIPLIQGEIPSENVKIKQEKEYTNLSTDIENTEITLDQMKGPEYYKGKYINWLNAKFYTVMDIPGNHPMKLKAFEELKRKGVMSQTANTEMEMKLQWQNYMKKQIAQQKEQERLYKMQMEQMRSQLDGEGGAHTHGHQCQHHHQHQPNSQQNTGQQQQPQNSEAAAASVGMNQDQFKQFQQDSQNEIRQMFQKRMEMMKKQQQFTKMEKQEEEQGGLLDDSQN